MELRWRSIALHRAVLRGDGRAKGIVGIVHCAGSDNLEYYMSLMDGGISNDETPHHRICSHKDSTCPGTARSPM